MTRLLILLLLAGCGGSGGSGQGDKPVGDGSSVKTQEQIVVHGKDGDRTMDFSKESAP